MAHFRRRRHACEEGGERAGSGEWRVERTPWSDVIAPWWARRRWAWSAIQDAGVAARGRRRKLAAPRCVPPSVAVAESPGLSSLSTFHLKQTAAANCLLRSQPPAASTAAFRMARRAADDSQRGQRVPVRPSAKAQHHFLATHHSPLTGAPVGTPRRWAVSRCLFQPVPLSRAPSVVALTASERWWSSGRAIPRRPSWWRRGRWHMPPCRSRKDCTASRD